MLLQRWLFAPALPSRGQVALSVGLVLVWANVHAAFMVGPLLIAAALAGVGVRYFTGFGPLRADIAFPLNRRSDVDDTFQFYVSFGQAF